MHVVLSPSLPYATDIAGRSGSLRVASAHSVFASPLEKPEGVPELFLDRAAFMGGADTVFAKTSRADKSFTRSARHRTASAPAARRRAAPRALLRAVCAALYLGSGVDVVDDPHVLPLIMSWDGAQMGYVELVWIMESLLATVLL
ncbi:hypothetical protein DFH11DRAFT_1882716 [Phellopilus nigrolimitatus]|nr:hypothetical protein DFH11DRAFT_1882716 [Phellopilus nigrolimitatus]